MAKIAHVCQWLVVKPPGKNMRVARGITPYPTKVAISRYTRQSCTDSDGILTKTFSTDGIEIIYFYGIKNIAMPANNTDQ